MEMEIIVTMQEHVYSMYLVEAWNSPFIMGNMAHLSENTEVTFAHIHSSERKSIYDWFSTPITWKLDSHLIFGK